MSRLVIGIDTGGTFTDFVVVDQGGGRLRRWKVLSTPWDPSEAIVQGLEDIFGGLSAGPMEIVHGTTVGTNAFIERKGARTCLFTTEGFEDVIFIGRQARPALYDLYARKPRDVVERDMVHGVRERCDASGRILTPVTPVQLDECVRFARDKAAESIAVCFLHSYLNSENEELLSRRLEEEGFKVFLSSRLLPEFREFERTSTTVINAYLGPVVGSYVRALERKLPHASIMVQLSGGGCIPADRTEELAVATILSGPAGGVLASLQLAKSLGIDDILTFDMGGTSTDVSLCPGELVYTRDYRIEGFPVNIPVIDVHTVGAGGGSIAWTDRGGLLKVGPMSAGADPGPVCYGKGEEITVTDANLFLGSLRPDRFLGGRMELDMDRVEEKMAQLGRRLGLGPVETALGIVRLVNLNMVQALRKVSIERGYDPRRFHLVSYGGAAGLHALAVAQELGMERVMIPGFAGVFSAQGLASSDLVFESSQGLFWRSSEHAPSVLERAVSDLRASVLEQAGVSSEGRRVVVESCLDVRYLGQSFELMIPFRNGWQQQFHREHERLYGYSMPEGVIEVTAVRVKAKLLQQRRELVFPAGHPQDFSSLRTLEPASLTKEFSDIIFEDGRKTVAVVDRRDIVAGTVLPGPFLITDDFTTIVVLEGWCVASTGGHLMAFKDSASHEDR